MFILLCLSHRLVTVCTSVIPVLSYLHIFRFLLHISGWLSHIVLVGQDGEFQLPPGFQIQPCSFNPYVVGVVQHRR